MKEENLLTSSAKTEPGGLSELNNAPTPSIARLAPPDVAPAIRKDFQLQLPRVTSCIKKLVVKDDAVFIPAFINAPPQEGTAATGAAGRVATGPGAFNTSDGSVGIVGVGVNDGSRNESGARENDEFKGTYAGAGGFIVRDGAMA